MGHRQSAVCISIEFNGQESNAIDHCVGSEDQALVVMLCVGNCGCVEYWVWMTVMFNGSSPTVVQR